AGAAYVPMEPDNPPSRIDYLLRDGGIDVVLTRTGDDDALEGTEATRVMLDRDDAFATSEDSDPHTTVSSCHAAYVIYTSGSTGLPKGVVVEHRSAVNFRDVLVATTHSACPARARVALNASFAFDMSLKGILQLLSGHCVYIIPQDIRPDGAKLLQFLQRHGIHAFDSTPSQLNALLAAGLLANRDYQPICVLLGGEPINAAVWNRLRASTIRFYNMYGPTECTIDATIGRIGEHDETPHIGRPIANAQVYLLDEYGQAVPRGTVGEIYIGGAGVARGYLNQPELTAERFVSDPYSRSQDARLYRTGDLGRWLDDGNLAYLGRNDLQVKLRGFRIELGEIESHLLAHHEVREVAVLAQGAEGAQFLVAYVVPAQDGFDAAALQFELKRALTALLPAYMVPQAFVFMTGLPLNANGKLDRERLSQEAFVRPSDDYRAPRTDTERTLAAIWGELMGLGDISVRANFFELGGQSLVAIRVVNEIVRRLEVELETRYIFEYSTIESLAAYIDNTLWTRMSKSAEHAELSDDEVAMEI
ncbi:MAG: amino acid adenylation domain-containing protein, partial [Lysobacter sp.]